MIVATSVHPALPYSVLMRGMMAAGAFVIAATLLLALVLFSKHNRLAYFLALILLAAISVVTIFDQFSLVDLVVLIMNVVPIEV